MVTVIVKPVLSADNPSKLTAFLSESEEMNHRPQLTTHLTCTAVSQMVNHKGKVSVLQVEATSHLH